MNSQEGEPLAVFTQNSPPAEGLTAVFAAHYRRVLLAAYRITGNMADARMNDQIVFGNVSKSYGEVLGVNRISLSILPRITTLVGPNGSGKTTLMNLLTGLVQSSSG